MLNIIKVKDPSSRWPLFFEFDPSETSFIVSDIKTKLALEKHLLENNQYLLGPSVLRMNEFFETISYDIQPNWNIVSDSFLSQKFLEFSSQDQRSYLKHLNNSKLLMDYLNQFLPILFHPKNSELLQEWFSQKGQSSSIKWRHWYSVCQNFFEIMKSEKLIHKTGIKSLVLNEITNISQSFFPKKQIVVDVGLSLDLCDALILKEFSTKKDVTFLVPELEQKIFYNCNDSIYHDFLKDVAPSQITNISVQKSSSISSSQTSSSSQEIFFSQTPEGNSSQKKQHSQVSQVIALKIKNETQLQEVKRATSQVRQWLEQGIPAKKITILAPNIESYWFALQPHLEKENIQVQKSITSPVISFPSINYWLSSLFLHLGFFEFSKLEKYFFYKDNPRLFHNFYSSYFNLSQSKHLNIDFYSDDKNGNSKKRKPQDMVSGREFIDWALSLFPKELEPKIIDCIYQVFHSFLLDKNLKWQSWLRLLESEIALQNIEIEPEQTEGISCLSFNAINSIQSSHIFIMGLDERSVQTYFPTVLTQTDRQALVSDLGFTLAYPHNKENEYKLLWLLQSSSLKEVLFSFSSVDFLGKALTPSLFYILSDTLFGSKECKRDYLTVWDSQKQQPTIEEILQEAGKDTGFITEIKTAFESPECFTQLNKITLSASRLKTYSDCGFKYAAKYLFSLKELDLKDRELSALFVGNIIHKMFKEILSQKSLDISFKNLESIIESIKPENTKFVHSIQWDITKKFLTNLAQEFIDKEKQKKEALPNLSPVFLEQKIKGFWDKESSSLQVKGDYYFEGSIDRIDQNTKDQSYWLIDYKGSLSSYTHIKSWADKDNLQLPLYAQALQDGLVENIKDSDINSASVSALLYYSYKDFSYKGYIDKANKNNFIKERLFFEDKIFNQSLNEVNKKVKNYILDIEEGKFFAIPKDKKICDTCSWRKWCRAKHLN